MRTVRVSQYNAFSKVIGNGNPAGVVLDADGMSHEDMQQIAERVGFNETVFVLSSNQADIRLRYFTPGHEMDLCGHATVAAIFALRSRQGITADKMTIETNVGCLPVEVKHFTDETFVVTMEQAPATFEPFRGDLDALAASLGVRADEVDDHLPLMFGSTGIWTLLVPIKRLASFANMQPHNDVFPSVLQQMPRVSVHPFSLETLHSVANIHARHFSSPFSGTIEDPVTGTASAVLGAYYKRYIDKTTEGTRLVIEQGCEIGKTGFVYVDVDAAAKDVKISGHGVYVSSFDVYLHS